MIYAELGDTAAAMLNIENFSRLDASDAPPFHCLVTATVRGIASARTECETTLRAVRHADDSALVYLSLGEHERAIDAVESAIRGRRPFLLVGLMNPLWDPVRANPRFQRLVEALRPAPDN